MMNIKKIVLVATVLIILTRQGAQAQELTIPPLSELESVILNSVTPIKDQSLPILLKLLEPKNFKNSDCYAFGNAIENKKTYRMDVSITHLTCALSTDTVFEMPVKAIVTDEDKVVGIDGRRVTAGKRVRILLLKPLTLPSKLSHS